MTRPRSLALACLAACLLAADARAGVITFADDRFDDGQVVAAVRDNPKVVDLGKELDALRHRFYTWKERDFRALFGKPTGVWKVPHALMCSEPRVYMISGFGMFGELSKSHTDTHDIGGVGAIVVRYNPDGQTPHYVEFYLRADAACPKLDRVDKLNQRLIWERAALAKMVKHIDDRWREVVVWEIDADAEKERAAGPESGDLTVKLRALAAWGEGRGYRLSQSPVRNVRAWYRGETVVFTAEDSRDDTSTGRELNHFVFYRPDGSTLRTETDRRGVQTVRWYHADGTHAGYESGTTRAGAWRPATWGWAERGEKFVRLEFDTNGDGIPDTFQDEDFADATKRKPMTVDQSWAVRPELIPEACRVADLPPRRVPIRKMSPAGVPATPAP